MTTAYSINNTRTTTTGSATNSGPSSTASGSSILDDNAKKLEFKTLIKEKILKPSKLERFNDIRTHHSHLVIRDSHYLLKPPTSFITCASCHRGRVLKIASIREATTEDILREVYNTISKNPCLKRKSTPKEPKSHHHASSTMNLIPTNQLINPVQDKFKPMIPMRGMVGPNAISSMNTMNPMTNFSNMNNISNLNNMNAMNNINTMTNINPMTTINNMSNMNSMNTINTINSMNTMGSINPMNSMNSINSINSMNAVNPVNPVNPVNGLSSSSEPAYKKPCFGTPHSLSSVSSSLTGYANTPSGLHPNQHILPPPGSTLSNPMTPHTSLTTNRIPTIDDCLDDFEDNDLPQIEEKLKIKSIGSSIKVTSSTITSLLHGNSGFPSHSDFFLSLTIEKDICKNYFTNDTLIIPLPVPQSTSFSKDYNRDHFLNDETLVNTINQRIRRFVEQQDLDLNGFKIVIIYNYFQDDSPDRIYDSSPQKYIGNIHVIHSFDVLEGSSLSYTNTKFSFSGYSAWVDQKEESIKTEIFNELIIRKLQNEIFMKYQQDLLGSQIHYSVLERSPSLNNVTFTLDGSFQVTPSSSLFIVNYMTLKLLRVLTSRDSDGLQMIPYILPIKIGSGHNMHILKLMLDRLSQHQQRAGIQTSI